MERAGIPIPGLQARDGLATINGSNVLTAMSALHLLRHRPLAAPGGDRRAMSLEALLANLKPYNSKLHELRGFSGAVRSAAAIRACIRQRPRHRQDQDQGAGRLLHAFHAAGPRRRARRRRLGARARWRSSSTASAITRSSCPRTTDADRRQLPGHAGRPAHGDGRPGHHDGLRALRAPAQPPGRTPP